MIMQYPMAGSTTLENGVTTVDCQKQVRSWRLLRSLLELLIPRCKCTLVEENHEFKEEKKFCIHNYYRQPHFNTSTTTITGTIIGYRRGKVSFCIQTDPKSTTPTLLLELAVSTSNLAREMKGGHLRIALECNKCGNYGSGSNRSLLSMSLWTMYCNGKKVGFAVKRSPSKADMEVLQQMESVVVGAGIIRGKKVTNEDDILYLRGNFERVQGSSNSESFHLMDHDGNTGQELSFFFLRSS